MNIRVTQTAPHRVELKTRGQHRALIASSLTAGLALLLGMLAPKVAMGLGLLALALLWPWINATRMVFDNRDGRLYIWQRRFGVAQATTVPLFHLHQLLILRQVAHFELVVTRRQGGRISLARSTQYSDVEALGNMLSALTEVRLRSAAE